MFVMVPSRKQIYWQNIDPAVELRPEHVWLAFNNLVKHECLTLSTET